MARSTFHHARISGISAVVPKEEIRLADELEFFGGDIKKAQRVTKMVGIDRRRVAPEGVTPADLCQQAAERLMTYMSLDTNTVDAIILVTQHPDYTQPATACILQDKLNLPKTCAAFDVNQGCAGYVYGLWIAFSFIESNAASRVLLLAGDCMARQFDKDNRITAPVFGDCGTATMIDRTETNRPSWFILGTDGSGAEALMIPAGGARIPLPKDIKDYAPMCERIYDAKGTPWRLNWIYMDGEAIFDFTINVIPPHIKNILEYSRKNTNDIDLFIPHQANKQIISIIAEKVGISEDKTLMEAFEKYGNTAVASIPMAICEWLQEGTVNATKMSLITGFGIGLSWASAVTDIKDIVCAGVGEFNAPPDVNTPRKHLKYWINKITDNTL
jgi:3-oxoacyl-[acyl-carrier-protein] synthase-3